MVRRRLGPSGGRDGACFVPALVATALLLAGCSSGGKAFESIEGSNENADRVRVYDSWDELVKMSREGEPGTDPVAAGIVGDVKGIEKGRSFRWEDDPEGEDLRVETEFGDPDAMISTYHLTVEVSSVFGADSDDVATGSPVLVGIAVDPDVSLEDVEKDFSDISGAVFFLQRSPVFDYDRSLFAIVEDGVLMAVPDDEGDLSFPLLGADDPVQPPDGVKAEDLKQSG